MSIDKTIGLLVPMQQEIELLIQNITVQEVKVIANRTFYTGILENRKVVLAQSRIGKVAATITATLMINEFKVDAIIVAGVGGGLSNEINVGDVVVATHATQHDMDARGLFEQFEIPLLGIKKFESNLSKIAMIVQKLSDFYESDIKNEDFYRNLDFPVNIHQGLLVSGDQFINTYNQVNKITELLPLAKVVDMEGAAVAQVGYEFDIEVINIRVISDKADENAVYSFNDFINNFAKHLTFYSIQVVVKLI